MKDINAIYHFNNGDYIIKQLKQLLKNEISSLVKNIFKDHIHISTKNSHSDVFEFIIYKDINIEKITLIKNILLNKILNHDFKLLENKLPINLDITIGCTKNIDNKMIKIYAEKALHTAKLNYQQFAFYDNKLYKNESISENIIDLLKYNIENSLVEPYLQAIMDNSTNKVIKYEALMRIFDKEGNVLLPNIFIHKAKRCKLYNKLMKILIQKVVLYIQKYKIHISINLDFTDIVNPNFKNFLISLINKNNIGSYLTIEILEGEKITNFELVNTFINDVRKYNVKIAIDDFGTGFSNYEYILSLNADFLKIDGSLIKKINEDVYFNLIKSIVLFCKQENIKIVAEFVSDLKILRYVKSIDIDYSQGYYISKPICISEIIKGNK